MRIYEKPSMTFANVTPKRVIADACWSNIANGSTQKFYWDTNGTEPGYYQFGLDSSNCGEGHFATNLNMFWWEGRGDENPALDIDGIYDHNPGPRLPSTHEDFIRIQEEGKHHFAEGIEDLIPKDS